MVMDPGLLFVMFFGVMVVAAIAVGFWSRRVYRKFPVAAGNQWLAGHGRAPTWGVAVFLLSGAVGLLASFWPVALVLGLVFLALGRRRLGLQSQADREIAGVLALCGTIWLAFAGHEAQLQALIGDAKRGVGAFLAIDQLITGSLLYFTSVVGLALGTDRRWFKWLKRDTHKGEVPPHA